MSQGIRLLEPQLNGSALFIGVVMSRFNAPVC